MLSTPYHGRVSGGGRCCKQPCKRRNRHHLIVNASPARWHSLSFAYLDSAVYSAELTGALHSSGDPDKTTKPGSS